MAYSNNLTLTLLANTDFSQLLGAPLQLVQINLPICKSPTQETILVSGAMVMGSVKSNKILTAMNVHTMTIDINNHGIIECWHCFALCTNERGQTGALFALTGTKRAQTRKAR
ncbi:hypothetical protein AB4302_08010 [Vibrio breoganii]